MSEPAAQEPVPHSDESKRSLNLVAIGASAGGITALQSFFEKIPERSGIAFVVIMHLSPEHESQLAEVLQPFVKIPVQQVRERSRIEPDHVYVIPPDRSIAIMDGHLELSEFEEPRGHRPIDFFFRTVAEIDPYAVGILLSGSGADGLVGLKAIKESGGIVMVQSPDEAQYDTMPRSAIASGVVDFVLPARELGERVLALRSGGLPWIPAEAAHALHEDDRHVLRRILTQLQAHTGHDFSGYKKNTILRRIARRIQVTGCIGLADYLRLIESSGPEAQALLKDLLIGVTTFFRDPAVLEALARTVVPALFRDPIDAQVRAWVAGCATGEEAYSVAMLLTEHADRLAEAPAVQIFASDLDAEAIVFARDGLYPDAVVADIGEERARRWFTRKGAYLQVKTELRERILFSQHDLLRDPPFSRLDLISCRNLLIYLEPALQDRVSDLFRYALREDGYLLLGESESVPERHGFRALDAEHRIYQRGHKTGEPDRLPDLPLDSSPAQAAVARWPRAPTPQQMANDAALHRRALELHSLPSVLVDRDRIIVHVSENANRFLQFPPGSPSANLLQTALPALRVELHAALFRALELGGAARTRLVPLEIRGEPKRVQMHVAPARLDENPPMALVTFLEEEAAGAGDDSSSPAGTGEFDAAEAELATMRSRLEEMIEASNLREENLRASNEAVQTVNEEYKSTLEELETSREELQSMNEELKTVNDELKAKLAQLNLANDDLRNLMSSTEIATLFLDQQLRIKRFTPALRQIFNILPSDEGRPLAHFTHSLDYGELASDCEHVLASLEPVEREVRNGEGHEWLVRITPYRTAEERISGVVCTFADITRIREAQEHLRQSEERFRALIDATAEMVWVTDRQGMISEDSTSWRAFTGQAREQWLGSRWLDAVHPDDRAEAEAAWKRAVQSEQPFEHMFRLWHAATDDWRFVSARVVPALTADATIREWVGTNTDMTNQREADAALQRAKLGAERAAEAKSQFLAVMSHELRTPLTAIIGIAEVLETDGLDLSAEDQKQHLARIKSCAWHLVSIIDDVLTYSATEAGRTRVKRGTVDLAEITREVAAMTEFEARPKGLHLELHDVDRPAYAFSDAGKIRQIVTNLMSNAVKFTDHGRVIVDVIESEDQIEIQVRDTGPGIPEDQKDAVFEPFVQVDGTMTREKGGAGLGLAVSRQLADLLGGEIALDTAPGYGCTFTFRLPKDP